MSFGSLPQQFNQNRFAGSPFTAAPIVTGPSRGAQPTFSAGRQPQQANMFNANDGANLLRPSMDGGASVRMFGGMAQNTGSRLNLMG